MATYTVKAPDGKTVTLQGPDGASQADIIAQAQKLYKPAAPAAAPNEFLDRYQAIRGGLAAKFTDPNQQQAALARFDADPRVQQLRKSAGLAPLSTRQGDVRATARKSVQQRVADAGADVGKGATNLQSASAGLSRGMFGIPEILAAAGERFLPSAITGNNTNASFSNILQMIRAKDTAAINAHPTAGLAGEVGGSVVGGGAAGKAVMGGARRLAATGAPVLARAAQTVENLGTLRKGARLANAAKLVTIGSAAGGAQAAGEGEDIPTGMAEGAIAAPVVAGGLKVAQVLTRPFRDVMRLSSAGQILSRLTSATKDQLAAKAASYRAATGGEPTLFELLPLADRNTILKQAVVGKDNVVERTSNAIRARAQNLGPEMSARAQQILQPQRTFIQNGLKRDIAAARGGTLEPGDEAMIANAMESPTDMLHLRDQEAKAIMAPHEATPVVANLEDLFPSAPIEQKIDTRGAGNYYHGARDAISGLNEGYYSPDNIYGGEGTLYTTDAYDVAKGYQRRHPAGVVYQTTENEPTKMFDMEKPLTEKRVGELFGDDNLAGIAWENLAHEGNKSPNLREVMDEMRRSSASEGLSKDDVQEVFSSATYNLGKEGYGGMTHKGGLLTGRDPHSVRIYFDPSKQLKLTEAPPPVTSAQIATDPEVATVIRSAAGTLRTRASGAGVTAGDITDMISTLRGDLGKGGIEGRTAERAINHLQDTLDIEAPDAGAAARQMTDAYAARSRMAEGMQEGSATRLRDDVQVGTSRRQARTVRNAYDTPEGANGRSLGQGNRALSDLGGSPEEALRATVKMSRGSTGRQVGQNVGTSEADQLIAASHAQDESAQALASASAKAQSGSGQGADAETLVQAIAGLHPSSFITTKSSAVRKLLDMTYIPENRAKTMVDMLFSQNPALTQRAMKAIGNEPNGAKFIKYLVGAAGQLTAEAHTPDDTTPPTEAPVDADADGPADAGAEAPTEAQEAPPAAAEPAPDAAASPSPYAPALLQIYQNENPDLIHLIQRVKNQESGGDQSQVSKKGAVGVMQVMPGTGPDAAKLAGVQWDPKAYKDDPAYNELIGIAYLSQLLRKYKGDVTRALAAYNAGPEKVDAALSTHGENFLSAMPAETQDYVQKVGA